MSNERKIKEAFNFKSIDLDRGAIWQEIEKGLPPKKKKRRWAFWIPLGIMGGILLMSSWYFLSDTQSINKTLSPDGRSIEREKNLLKNNISTSDTKSTNATIDRENPLAKTLSIAPPTTSNRQAKSVAKEQVEQSLTDASTAPFDPTGNFTDPERDRLNLVNPPLEIQHLTTDQNALAASTTKLGYTQIEVPSLLALPIQSADFFTSKKQELTKGNNQNLLLAQKSRSKWQIGWSTRFFAPQRTLNGIDPQTVSIKEDSSSPLHGFSTQLTLAYSIHPFIRIKTGIDYTQFVERIEWSGTVSSNSRLISSDSARVFVYNQEKYYLSGELNEVVTSQRSLRHYNTFQLYSIPIEINFLPIQSSRYALGFVVGYKFNFSRRFQGKFLDQTGRMIEEEADNMFRSRAINSYYLGINKSVRLFKKTHLTASLSYTKTSNFLKTEAAKQNYHWFDFGLELSVGF
ncbi:MAG: hypothetical protein AAF985_08470 [Bacteroidota bacterium]